MFENTCIDEKVGANEMAGLQGGVKIMAMPCDNEGLCSPTSALEKKANGEQGAEESFLTDSDKFILVEPEI